MGMFRYTKDENGWPIEDEHPVMAAHNSEVNILQRELAKSKARIESLEDALAGLLSGLDSNGPEGEYEGLSDEAWNKLVHKARATLDGGPQFCRSCGAGIGKFRRTGEGTCPKCDPEHCHD